MTPDWRQRTGKIPIRTSVRILREELIHVRQQRAGMEVSRAAITAGELAVRYELIRNRHA